ncbi:TIGR01244 family phosphatase [Halovulum dunhuangense]|uniref:TIGR01244 family phosphatase n=1 Tax=Halovulum dunhuangense TaxID=1505036 RepID=A0A849L4K2_9RHOB|nr:TIGR01244 family sulfur transferase [Halovulum dunhuangense]NNU81130.1 TIGR01244 family phosphatase [Halovulum dunhuangense]
MIGRQLVPGLSVGAQIHPEDLPALARAGIRGIIINRPDGEEPGQPGHDAITEAALAVGIHTRYIPAFHGQIGEAEVQAFAAALDTLPEPIFAYCRSGARSTLLWNMAEPLSRRFGSVG